MSIILANDIKVGYIIRYNEKACRVLDTQHVKPGKGGAYMQLEMKECIAGTKHNIRLRSSESVEKLSTDTKTFDIIMLDEENVTIMDNETFEQVLINKDRYCGDDVVFLEENGKIIIEYIDDEISNASAPETAIFVVSETEPHIKNSSSNNSFKPAYNEKGIKVLVPHYISVGDKVMIKTKTREFIEKI